MPRGDTMGTVDKILQAAEELFAEKGFNGTSVNMIAQQAEVNKALIYYYFKDKNDIIISLWNHIIKESEEYICSHMHTKNDMSLEDKIKNELMFMTARKKILAVLLMETLKGDNKDNHLFQIAESLIHNDHCGLAPNLIDDPEEMQRYLVKEFFTGFIPIIAFIVLQDKWCDFFKCNTEKLTANFLESFNESHLATHENK